jgi:hypothetical protein
MKHQRATIKERIAEGVRNKQMGGSAFEESEPLTDEAWFMIIFLLSIGAVIGFAAGVFLV